MVLTQLQIIRFVVIMSHAHLNADGLIASLQQTTNAHQLVSNQVPADIFDTLKWSKRMQVKADRMSRL